MEIEMGLMVIDIVSTSGEIPEKFIRELHELTTHVKNPNGLTLVHSL